MVNFIKFFEAGIDHAKTSDANRKEVNSVFEELNRQLGQVANGNITVQRESFAEPSDNPLDALSLKPRKSYLAISARHRGNNAAPAQVLARWHQAPAGYPCRIELTDGEVFCENREGLERGLSELLSDPVVGGKLYKLINLPSDGALQSS